MKVAFDVHGTIDDASFISKSTMRMMLKIFMDSGLDIYIISGPPEEQIHKELKKLGYIEGTHFHYDNVFSVVDFIRFNTDVKMTQDEKGYWWCDETFWWDSKGIICEKFGIDIMFDNDIRYKKNMPHITKFIHWEKYSGKKNNNI